MYLLNHSDHYTSHSFQILLERVCEWSEEGLEVSYTKERKYRREISKWKSGDKIIAINPIMDYLHRPEKYESVCLYNWVRRATKAQMSKRRAELQEREGGFLINEILSHKWIGRILKFMIKWNLGDKSWISRTEAKHLKALGIDLDKLNVKYVKDLPKVTYADVKQEEPEIEDQVEDENWALTERDSYKMEELEQKESEESEDKVYNSNEDDNLNAEAIDFTSWVRFSETYS